MELENFALNTNNNFNCEALQLDMELFMESDSTMSPKSHDGKFLPLFDDKKQVSDFDQLLQPNYNEEFIKTEKNCCIYQNIGGQRKMLDRFSKHQFCINNENIELYGIFDGHGNSKISEYLAQNLHQKLMSHKLITVNPSQAIAEVFKEIDYEILQQIEEYEENCGSTALIVLITSQLIITINLGDSRAILLKNDGNYAQLTEDHKPSRPDEKQRIESLGGYIVPIRQVERVQGVLAVSRSFGNKRYRPYISSEPDIKMYKKDINSSQKLLLATDGLFNECSNEDIVYKINQLQYEQDISLKLYQQILKENEYIKDNTTIMIIDL